MRMKVIARDIATDRCSARRTLFDLQVEQHQHDETYHREIARLSMHQRLNHMALHFAKYNGRVASFTDVARTIPAYVDTLIIGISTANILNIELWDLLNHDAQEFSGLFAFARTLVAQTEGALDDRAELLRQTSIAVGRVAGACEKIDHLEEINFRSEIRSGLSMLVRLSLAILAQHEIDPAVAVRERLRSVKSRLVLNGRI